ncbi:MAG: GNAT family N-acetyltransferase [Vicinamibacteria bacterium]
MPPRTPILETERLALREMEQGDLDFVSAMLADPEVMRYYPQTYSREEAAEWIRKQSERYERDGHGLWLVECKASGEPVGQVGLMMQQVEGGSEPEIGYLIHRPFWRRGYAYEAAAATRELALGALGKRRVISLVRPINVPSQAVARKLGMRPERSTTFRGLEHLVYALELPPPLPGLAS